MGSKRKNMTILILVIFIKPTVEAIIGHTEKTVYLFDLYRYIVSRPMRYRWDNYIGLPRDLYVASHAWERSVIFSRRFFEAFVDLFGAFFLYLKDHFCVSRIVSSHAKIHKSDNDGIIFCLRSLYTILTYQRTCIAVSPILVQFWGPYRSIGLIAIFFGSEDQNIVLLAILFFQCTTVDTINLI